MKSAQYYDWSQRADQALLYLIRSYYLFVLHHPDDLSELTVYIACFPVEN